MFRRCGAAVAVVVVALWGGPVEAQSSTADLSVDLSTVDDLADPQATRVRLTNLGPGDSEHPILTVALDGGVIVEHTGDPQPGSLEDGVGCTADERELSCSFERVASNTAVSIDVAVRIDRSTHLRASAEAAGTPDPNPTANNIATLDLHPAEADLALDDVVLAEAGPRSEGEELSLAEQSVVELRATVIHRSGREGVVDLLVGGVDRLADQACVQEGRMWRCEVGRLAPGMHRQMSVRLERPGPDDAAEEVRVAAVADGLIDPDPEAARAAVELEPREPVAGDLVRHAGAERVGTAIAISQARFGADDASAVVLARADAAADALAGGPLAAELDAPILLTPSGSLSRESLAEIDRVMPRGHTVHILGGHAAISEAVERAVRDAGYDTTRIMGPNRYATAVAVYEALGRPTTVTAADGDGHVDAVVAGAAMAAVDGALVLTAGGRLPDGLAPLRTRIDWAVGNPAAEALPGAAVLAGRTPAATSVAVAEAFLAAPEAVGVATSTAFPDALAGGPLTAGMGAPLLLSDTRRLSTEVTDYLAATPTVTAAHLLGGTAALSTDVEEAIAQLIAR